MVPPPEIFRGLFKASALEAEDLLMLSLFSLSFNRGLTTAVLELFDSLSLSLDLLDLSLDLCDDMMAKRDKLKKNEERGVYFYTPLIGTSQ